MTDPVVTAVKADTLTLEQRVQALETQAKTWYEKHLPLLAAVGGLIFGLVVGHLVKG